MVEELQESDGSGCSAITEEKQATFYQWKLRHYFTVVEEGDKNMRLQCKLCAPSSKTLSSAHNTTSNLKKHLNTVHKTTTLVPITPGKTGKRKLDSVDKEQWVQAKKKCTLPSVSKLNLSRLRGLVAECIIKDMLPLSTVESPAFKRLVCDTASTSSSNVQLPDRKSFTLFLDKAYNSMIARVKATLETVERVCTTAEVWTAS